MQRVVAYPPIYDDKIHDHESNKQTKTILEKDLSKHSVHSTGHSLGSLYFFPGDVTQEFLAVSARFDRRLTHSSSCLSPPLPTSGSPASAGLLPIRALGFSRRAFDLRHAYSSSTELKPWGRNFFMRQPEDPESPEPPKPVKEPPPGKHEPLPPVKEPPPGQSEPREPIKEPPPDKPGPMKSLPRPFADLPRLTG